MWWGRVGGQYVYVPYGVNEYGLDHFSCALYGNKLHLTHLRSSLRKKKKKDVENFAVVTHGAVRVRLKIVRC